MVLFPGGLTGHTAVYKPLAQGQIRVLCLEKPRQMRGPGGVRRKVVVAKFHQIDLNIEEGQPYVPFVALSYCWDPVNAPRIDPSTKQFYAQVDGHFLGIKYNLYHALLQLSEQEGSSVVWADAICINQKDEEEKVQQIGLMRKIYMEASEVLAWLGPATDRSRQEAIKEFWAYLRDNPTRPKLQRKGCEAFLINAMLDSIYESEWFDRVWTLQEGLLNRHVVIQYGHQRLDLDILYSQLTSLLGIGRSNFLSVWASSRLQEVVRGTASWTSDLFALLSLTCHRRASRPQDKVFGILGLYTGVHKVAVDYSLSVREVYLDAAVITILESGGLPLLKFAGVDGGLGHDDKSLSELKGNVHQLPSWVPDWSQLRRPPVQEIIKADLGEWKDLYRLNSLYTEEEIEGFFDSTLSHRPPRSAATFMDSVESGRLHWRGYAFGRVHIVPARNSRDPLEGIEDANDNHATVPLSAEFVLKDFPPCTLPNPEDSIEQPPSPACSEAHGYVVRGTELGQICLDLKLHDKGKCNCPDPPSGNTDCPRRPLRLNTPREMVHAHEHDWVCLLDRTTSPVILRPDCRASSVSQPRNSWTNDDTGDASNVFIFVGMELDRRGSRSSDTDLASQTSIFDSLLEVDSGLMTMPVEFEIR